MTQKTNFRQRRSDTSESARPPILRPGETCWRTAEADRLAVISDGKLSAVRPVSAWTREAIGLEMLGAAAPAETSPARENA